MTIVGSVAKSLVALGIMATGLASVTHAAGVDRKAYQQERARRVSAAASARSVAKATPNVSGGLNRARLVYVQRLVSAELHSISYANSLIAAENRLIASQNRVIRQLDATSNPRKTGVLLEQAKSLQASINRDLTFLNAIQPAISATLTAIQSYAYAIPGLVNSIEQIVARDERAIAVIAARPLFTYPPATPSI